MGVDLALQYDGEIIGADSRQVYRGMDIGTGKDLAEFVVSPEKSIPYHLIDVADPNDEFDVVKFVELANKAIEDVLKIGKLPIVVGGTGFYLQALVDGISFSKLGINKELHAELEKFSKEELFEKLHNLKVDFAERLNQSDRGNKRRLIRYVEIAMTEPEALSEKETVVEAKYDFILVGIKRPRDVLVDAISKRLRVRLEQEGMVDEVARLHEEGVSWKRLESFGLEYKFVSWYLQEKIEYDEMVERLDIAIRQFAKRQMTWFRRWEKMGAKIHWVENINQIPNF